MNTIATLYQLQQYLGLASGDDDLRLLDALQSAAAQIERLTGRRFCPRVATIDHSVNPRQGNELLLADDLLVLTALTGNDGHTYAVDDVLLFGGADEPAGILVLTDGTTFTWADTPVLAISVTGTWGWHDQWSLAWRSSGDVVKDAALSASATTITVGDAAGTDAENESPRFQVGHLLKIDDEYLRIVAITLNTGDDTLTVLRGVNGTTAATHAQNAAICTYQPAADVKQLNLRWAAWLYREPDNRAPLDVPPGLWLKIEQLRRVGVKA